MFQFFNSLLKDGQVLNLSLMKCGGKMTVGVHPQSLETSDDAQSRIVPLVLTGSPEELDEKFFPLIAKPIEEATSLLSNLEEFSKSLEKASAESKAAKDVNSKVNKLMKEAEYFEKANKTSDALTAYRKILETDAGNSKAKAKISELSSKLKQADMFAEEINVQEIVQVVSPVPLAGTNPMVSKSETQIPQGNNNVQKEEESRQPVNDMFAELMGTTVKASKSSYQETVPLPEEKEIPPVSGSMNIPADQWEQFQQFQKFQSSMNGKSV